MLGQAEAKREGKRASEAAARAPAAALADPVLAGREQKSAKPIPCRSPVDRLYLQARQNLT